jgi:hypothetical protein
MAQNNSLSEKNSGYVPFCTFMKSDLSQNSGQLVQYWFSFGQVERYAKPANAIN